MSMQPDYSREEYQDFLFQVLKIRAQKGAGYPKESTTSSQHMGIAESTASEGNSSLSGDGSRRQLRIFNG